MLTISMPDSIYPVRRADGSLAVLDPLVADLDERLAAIACDNVERLALANYNARVDRIRDRKGTRIITGDVMRYHDASGKTAGAGCIGMVAITTYPKRGMIYVVPLFYGINLPPHLAPYTFNVNAPGLAPLGETAICCATLGRWVALKDIVLVDHHPVAGRLSYEILVDNINDLIDYPEDPK